MPYVQGFLIEGPVDPGFGRPGVGAGSPGHDLPSGGHPWVPGHVPPIGGTLPEPPVGMWPPPSWNSPITPVPEPPPNTKPPPPGAIWPPIEGVAPGKTFVVVVGIPGVGWRYTVVDPGLSWGTPLPPAPAPKA